MSTKHIQILFKPDMVQAILAGRKTQTRRVVKNQVDAAKLFEYSHDWERKDFIARCPYGKPSDVLWVRETFARIITPENQEAFVYQADDDYYKETVEDWPGWSPSRHMPKAACRLWLKVKAVRVERLQEISRTDAAAEGVCYPEGVAKPSWLQTHRWPEENFSYLWQSINGPESWSANPWVWVIEFERCHMPDNFLQYQNSTTR